MCNLIVPLNDSEAFTLCASALLVFNTPGAAGIEGFPIKSLYVPVFAILCNVILPLNDSLDEVD